MGVIHKISEAILQMHREGKSRAEIRRALNVSKGQVAGVIMRDRLRDAPRDNRGRPIAPKAKVSLPTIGPRGRAMSNPTGLNGRKSWGGFKHPKVRNGSNYRSTTSLEKSKHVCLDGSPGQEPIGCLYIAQEITEPGWAYCQAKRQEGSPYCGEHHKVCYRPLVPKQLEAA